MDDATAAEIEKDKEQWRSEHGGYDPNDFDSDDDYPADYDDPGADFNDGEFWEEAQKLKEIAGIKESHPANEQWLEAFEEALGFDPSPYIKTSTLIGKYSTKIGRAHV